MSDSRAPPHSSCAQRKVCGHCGVLLAGMQSFMLSEINRPCSKKVREGQIRSKKVREGQRRSEKVTKGQIISKKLRYG